MAYRTASIGRASRRLDRVAERLWRFEDADLARRARVLTVIVAISVVASLAGALAYAFDPEPARAVFLLAVSIPLGSALLVLNATHRVDVATHWLCIASTATAFASIFLWDGIFSVYGWMVGVPVVASAAAGSRAGLAWTAIITVVLSAIATRFASGPVDETVGLNAALAAAIVGATLAITEGARERAILDRVAAEGEVESVRVERVRAEQELAASQTLFSAAFARAPSSLVVSDLETGEILDVNERWIEYFGHSRDDAIGRTMVELGIWGESDTRDALLERVLRGDEAEFEVPLRRKDGSEMWILSSAVPLEFDGRRCLVCQGIDVTERVHTDASLARYREALEDLVVEQRDAQSFGTPTPDDVSDAVDTPVDVAVLARR